MKTTITMLNGECTRDRIDYARHGIIRDDNGTFFGTSKNGYEWHTHDPDIPKLILLAFAENKDITIHSPNCPNGNAEIEALTVWQIETATYNPRTSIPIQIKLNLTGLDQSPRKNP